MYVLTAEKSGNLDYKELFIYLQKEPILTLFRDAHTDKSRWDNFCHLSGMSWDNADKRRCPTH